MDIEEYHCEVRRTTDGTSPLNEMLTWGALGIAGESGEVVDIIKKHVYHDHQLDRGKLYKEMGDVLWYLTYLSNALGVSLAEIMEINAAKLRQRYPDGWSKERSVNRTA